MAYEQKDMTFKLFVNDRKVKETDYDYTGIALINGVAYFVNAWKQEKGKLIMSGNFKARKLNTAPKPKPATYDDYEDSIPF